MPRLNEPVLSYQTTTATVRKVAAIPPTGKGMENEPVNKIVVTEQTGREALELAAHSYRDLHINPDYSQKSARRTVGYSGSPLPGLV